MEKKMDKMTLELNSPITEEQWDLLEDVDLDNTERIYFHTKHGKEVEFVKRKRAEVVMEILKKRKWSNNHNSL